jgi:hypothetical protein
LRPDDHRWTEVDVEFRELAPRSYEQARKVLTDVLTQDRIERHAFREMLDAFVVVLELRNAYWPQFVELRPAARSDHSV